MAITPACRTVLFILSFVLLVLGVVLVVFGLLCIFLMPSVIHNMIAQRMILENGTTSFSKWVDPPATIHVKFRAWHLTNSLEMLTTPGAIPIYEEKGPFTYKQKRVKFDFNPNPENYTITYRQKRLFTEFVPELSDGNPENVTITTINVVLVLIGKVLNELELDGTIPPWLFHLFLNGLWSQMGERYFETYSMHDLLWGWRVPAIVWLKQMAASYNVSLDHIDERIGLFKFINNTDDGLLNVFTGRNDINLVNRIHSWRGNRTLPYWGGQYAQMINGTDGQLNKPGIQRTDKLETFVSDLCRGGRVEYVRDTVVHGLELFRFEIPQGFYEDPYGESPDAIDNRGYCIPNGTLDNCRFRGGIIDISTCRSGMPILMSNPHFLWANKIYLDAVKGMNPDKEKHLTFVEIEPNSGATVKFGKRVQLNLLIEPMPTIAASLIIPVNGTVFPIVWMEESTEINETTAESIKGEGIGLIPIITRTLPAIFIPLGVIFILVSACLIGYLVWEMKQQKKDLPDMDPSYAKSFPQSYEIKGGGGDIPMNDMNRYPNQMQGGRQGYSENKAYTP